ncbi:MAG: hypothetical protein B6I18_03305, partial [Bacteroidetes bacterium 4572_112]
MLCFTALAMATIINVDQDPNRPSGYYENLQLALNTAVAGDTIYLYPSNSSYGSIEVKKEIHIFGVGFDGTSGSVSRIGDIRLDSLSTQSGNPSASSFQGIKFSSLVCQKKNMSNIVIAGCEFSSVNLSYNCSSWLIVNNLISGYISVSNNSLIIISNNIFMYSDYGIQSSNSPSVIVSHNLFFNWQDFNSVYNAIITDNIFMFNSYASSSSSMAHNIFNNNLGWRSALNPGLIPPESNTGSGNISNQDPEFITASSTPNFDKTKDYHLSSSSAGKNAATDGTDIGVYGGSTPFVWGGVFSIPKIILTNITNPVINQSTPINVNIKANKAKL